MIHQLCNLNNEQTDTFNRLSVIKKNSLPLFNHLTSDAALQSIIASLADDSDVINTDLLPENISVSHTTRTDGSGKSYRTSISFVLTPLDKNLQDLLSAYNNEEVVVLLKRYKGTFLYGTTLSPLVLTYNELHSSRAANLKGYTVRLQGNTLGSSKQFENFEFDLFNRGLAFELAGSL
jgi:hypothetical protein